MKKYTIYFEIFDKKLKTEIFADSKEHAKQQIKNKIIFHKINEKEISNPLEDFFNGFKK